MDLYGHDDKTCPECHRSYRSHGDMAYLVDGEWLCQSCFMAWAREEMSAVDMAEALGVKTKDAEDFYEPEY